MNSRVGTAFGNYNITRLLGKGGMGEVYEAYDTSKGRTVALKILADELSRDDTFRARFQRESRAAAILQEPHIIPIHDWGEIDGSLFIDMRLVEGHTLAELLAEGPLDPPVAVSIITQIGAALDAAHAHGLIHRDVKPQNIIVTPADFAYLVDFGIAETQGDTRLTTAGTQIGTFNYMAPERFSNKVTTPAVDVYALACVLYESLTGDTPFATDSLESLVAAHIASPPPRPRLANPRVPAAFDDVIARGMAKGPDDRYETANSLARAAQHALHSGQSTLGGAPTMPSPGGFSPAGVEPASMTAATAASPHAGTSADAALASPLNAAPTGPTTALADRHRAHRRRRRMLMSVVAAAAVLIIAGIGTVIGLLVHRNSSQTAGPSPATANHSVEPTNGDAASLQPPPTQSPPSPGTLPPLVTGPDQSALHRSCDQGFTLPGATGFGTHAGRGSPETFCPFAKFVLTAYWAQYRDASPQPRTVSVPAGVDCRTKPGAPCDGSNFLMQCQQNSGDSWITCTGGGNARLRVYLW